MTTHGTKLTTDGTRLTTHGTKLATHGTKRQGRVRRGVAVASRWLHIYLSMVSFAVVLFFAATGLLLNHPDWFSGQQRTRESHGTVPGGLLRGSAGDVDRLGIVELLRSGSRVHGAMSDFRVEDGQVSVSFRAPGYTADAFIDRASGKYDLTTVESGTLAVMNDLHKGRDAGKAWGVVIDVSAVLLVLVSLTGLVLVWFVLKRRTSGLLVAALATAAVVLLAKFVVP